jgi:plasmid stabilization system protein ParE
MKVRFTDTALAEIAEVISHIASNNVAAALRVASQVDHTIQLISGLPLMGRPKYRGDVRMLPARRYPQYILCHPGR